MLTPEYDPTRRHIDAAERALDAGDKHDRSDHATRHYIGAAAHLAAALTHHYLKGHDHA